MSEIAFTNGYVPGVIGRITELHGTYYNKHWSFGLFFEAKAAYEISELFQRFDAQHDGFWAAHADGKIVGSVVIDGKDRAGAGARLRWFILDEAYHGQGIGQHLITLALDFCRNAGMRHVYLTTFAGLDTARYLYERHGFKLVEEAEDSHWGMLVREQKFEVEL